MERLLRQGLLQAYRYPNQFNGIIAGDPADVRRNSWALWLTVHSFKDPADLIPPSKYPMIHRYFLNACDAIDGLKDGLIDSPEKCHVDFAALQCQAADNPDCLTPRQVQTAQAMISPAVTSPGHFIFPRLEPGTELRWARLAGGPVPADLFLDQFRYVVCANPQWDWRSFDLARDAATAHNIDQLDPHLAPFAKHEGKLLLYHGWADQQVAPAATIAFFRAATELSGDPARASQWIRLFMARGMAHCSGGEGPNVFDKISLIDDWVEHGHPPTRIVAAHETARPCRSHAPSVSLPASSPIQRRRQY